MAKPREASGGRPATARSPAEQLDRALEAMMAGTSATRPRVGPAIAALLSIASDLRSLPRAGFKESLAAGLAAREAQPGVMEAGAMSAGPAPAAAFLPAGVHAATPCLVLKDPDQAIEFYKKGFGATERMRLQEPGGGKILHAEIQIGDCVIALAAEEPDYNLSPAALGGSPVITQLYVEDVDRFAERAIAAGASVIFPVADQFYGDRAGRLADPFGHLWIVATHQEDVSMDEMQRRAQAWAGEHRATQPKPVQSAPTRSAAGSYRAEPHLFVGNAAGLMDFLKRAFGADEVSCHKLPDGLIAHAEMRIGDSTIGIGEATGGAAPMPAALHLYVKNADAVYRRALAAGAVSIQEPADQEYGDREAGVKDPAGNHWYIATHKGEFAYEQTPARGQRRAARKPPHHIPEGMHSVTPYLHPRGAERLIDFLQQAFEAREAIRVQPPGDFIHHAKVMIGDSMVELGEAHGPYGPLSAMFHLYVDDPDTVYRRALAAGGVSLSEPADQPWGFRSAGVQDPGGNQWWINAPIARVDTSESSSATAPAPVRNLNPVMPFMFIRAAAEAVEFYRHVFGARELMRETEPHGIVSHAQFQIGQSLFMISNPASQDVNESAEKGYARTPHELGGSPLHLYLQVPDVDRVFNKAIAAGAQVVHPLNDMEWGDRVGGFEDPFGHVWYVATPLNAPAARPDTGDR